LDFDHETTTKGLTGKEGAESESKLAAAVDNFRFPTELRPPRRNNLQKCNMECCLHVDGPGKDCVLHHNTAGFYLAKGLKNLDHKAQADDIRKRKFQPNRKKSIGII